jgi:hypothetical protein
VVVVTFDSNTYNFVVAGAKSYFLLRLADGSRLLLSSRCKHRGGPLHLGRWDEERHCLVCPWHQTRYTEAALRRSAVPLVSNNGVVTIVLDEPEGAPVHVSRRAILVEPCSIESANETNLCELKPQAAGTSGD